MKNLVSLLFLTILGTSCSTTKPLQKTVTQKYYNLVFSPINSTKKITPNIDVTITPINAKNLNQETYEAAFRDGDYEKEFISTIENWKSKLQSLPKTERLALQGRINALDYLSKLEREEKIPPQLSIRLKRRIVNDNSGSDGSEIESLSDAEVYPSEYNPYKTNSNYFSVFKMTFENSGNDVEKIGIKEFQLSSNEEQLYPLSSHYFEENLKDRVETVKNLFRLNLPDDLNVTPKQKVSKYIAVPAINANNNKLQVQFIRSSNVVNCDFDISKKEETRIYKLDEYTLKYDGEGDGFLPNTYYLISFKDNVSFPLKHNKVFVSEEKKNMQVTIYGININLLTSEISFGTSEEFSFSNVTKNKKKIHFVKIKKDKITGTY